MISTLKAYFTVFEVNLPFPVLTCVWGRFWTYLKSFIFFFLNNFKIESKIIFFLYQRDGVELENNLTYYASAFNNISNGLEPEQKTNNEQWRWTAHDLFKVSHISSIFVDDMSFEQTILLEKYKEINMQRNSFSLLK